MRYRLELIPGKSIGPFQLGMTNQEIDDAMLSLTSEPLSLSDLQIRACCYDEQGNVRSLGGTDRCELLEIIVDRNEHEVVFLGVTVNGIEKEEAHRLLQSLGSPVVYRFCACEVPEQGIETIRWDSGYDEVYCFWVTRSKTPSVTPQ